MLITFTSPHIIGSSKFATGQTADIADDTARTLVERGYATSALPGELAPENIAPKEWSDDLDTL